MSRRRRNLESTILIWLTNKPEEKKFDRLRSIIDYVHVSDNIDTCNQYIEQVPADDRIYLITDTPYTSKRAQVYTYQTNDSFDEVIQTIAADHKTQINPLGINIFQQSTHSPLNSEFLWFQRILAVLFDSDDRDKAKQHFLDAYKKYFDGNRQKEEKIQFFESTYQSSDALQWYTRECFFYETLNKALRTQDIDVLFSFRFFLKDIYEQLKLEYEKTSHDVDQTVYRGQTISSNELQTIRENLGQLISLNSFISTTIEKQTATGFSLSGDPAGERVLFQIQINRTTINSKPFADISRHSQFADEKEVLFMAGSIFEIRMTTFSDSLQMWIVELQLCNDNVYELYDVYQSDRTIVSEQKSCFSFASVLLQMNLFEKARKYYQQLLEEGSMNEIPSIDLMVNCYWGLSDVNCKQGEFDIALAYQCLAIELSQNRPDLLLASYKYISLVYLDIHSISEALEYQTKALEIQQAINDDQNRIADTLYNFGIIYLSQLLRDKDRALEYFLQALAIYQESNVHIEVIRCYDAIGQIYLDKKQKETALNHHLQALQLIDEYYPSYLPYRSSSYEYLARVYESMRDYERALKYYHDALDVKLKYEPVNHPHIADSYELIGGLYHKKGEYAKAIEMYNKAIDVRRQIHSESHPQVESIVYMRNSLQEYTENHPGEVFDYESSSEEGHEFQSIQEALNYMNEQMETDDDDDDEE